MKFINVIVLILILVLSYGCNPKNNSTMYQPNLKTNRNFVEQMEEGSTHVFSTYYTMVEKTISGEYIKKQFFPDTKQITHYYTYSNVDLSEKNGYAKEWWDNGDMRFEGNFKNEKRTGEWKEYFNGVDYSSISKGQYVNGEKDGLWVTHNGKNILLSETSYKNGKKHGAYKIFTKEGRLLEKGIYENDKQTQREVLDSESTPGLGGGEIKIVETMPSFKGCEKVLDKEKQKECADNKMLVFIYSNIKYPAKARKNGVEGRAIAKFMVDRNGEITNVNVMRGVCKEIKTEVERILKMLPDFHPGTQRGKPVKVWFTIPVSFKLQG